jgi:hypothetical protein
MAGWLADWPLCTALPKNHKERALAGSSRAPRAHSALQPPPPAGLQLVPPLQVRPARSLLPPLAQPLRARPLLQRHWLRPRAPLWAWPRSPRQCLPRLFKSQPQLVGMQGQCRVVCIGPSACSGHPGIKQAASGAHPRDQAAQLSGEPHLLLWRLRTACGAQKEHGEWTVACPKPEQRGPCHATAKRRHGIEAPVDWLCAWCDVLARS